MALKGAIPPKLLLISDLLPSKPLHLLLPLHLLFPLPGVPSPKTFCTTCSVISSKSLLLQHFLNEDFLTIPSTLFNIHVNNCGMQLKQCFERNLEH